ncbi:MFS family permease [Rhodoblastus acidophilus]|uniref:MFS transporter n=1 Tax=Rhodoblastus acidophilus TaxID=1074 RepID=UPI0022254191|nr:MFS transporter [Rhodoblastus acidophilus]MCW2283912.1 MFS family permease [Rhodoblastus acidophilus]MCW2332608.1 MFS family permease [Rhodoblastus acidophilus]
MSADGTVAPEERRRIIVASVIGTTIEFFDFYVYATAAVSIFPLLFFPKGEGTAALLASMAAFGVAFVARPIGSMLFGHFGDRAGRKATLIGSLLLMGLATFAVGLLPPYHSVGLLAPALLASLRFCQGLGLGGEWSGAALLAVETAAPGERAKAAMWPQLGAPFGFILANGSFLALTTAFAFQSGAARLDDPFLVWGWRLPFLASILMVLVGLYARIKLNETPVFLRAVERGEKLRSPVTKVFRDNFGALVRGAFIMVATYGIFYLMNTWTLSYAIGKVEQGMLGVDYRTFLSLQLVAVLFFALFIPVSGALADRFGRRRLLIVVTGGIILFGLSFGWFLSPAIMGSGAGANLWLMGLFLSLGMSLMGLSFGPMSALLPELFPTNTRYTGSGISYNAASILGAALTPFAATWLASAYGPGLVGYYLAGLGGATLVALLLSEETRAMDLETMEASAAAIEATSP